MLWEQTCKSNELRGDTAATYQNSVWNRNTSTTNIQRMHTCTSNQTHSKGSINQTFGNAISVKEPTVRQCHHQKKLRERKKPAETQWRPKSTHITYKASWKNSIWLGKGEVWENSEMQEYLRSKKQILKRRTACNERARQISRLLHGVSQHYFRMQSLPSGMETNIANGLLSWYEFKDFKT